jgi:small conductance mechanosensitive channel
MDELPSINLEQVNTHVDQLTSLAVSYGPKLILAIVTLVVGLWLINAVTRRMQLMFEHAEFDESLTRFLGKFANIALKALLLISVAAMVGIETTSFLAALGAAGLAVGLALQGSLSNFAGGVLILILKPYKVGDFIESGGLSGVVREIGVVYTTLTTGDNKTVIIPNGGLANGSIINYSTQTTRRVEAVFGIGYGDDLRKAKDILKGLIAADSRIHAEPEPLIVISSLGDSAVNITTRSWVNSGDFWGVYFDLTENAKLAFDENNISIPYPQQDVHLHRDSVQD